MKVLFFFASYEQLKKRLWWAFPLKGPLFIIFCFLCVFKLDVFFIYLYILYIYVLMSFSDSDSTEFYL